MTKTEMFDEMFDEMWESSRKIPREPGDPAGATDQPYEINVTRDEKTTPVDEEFDNYVEELFAKRLRNKFSPQEKRNHCDNGMMKMYVCSYNPVVTAEGKHRQSFLDRFRKAFKNTKFKSPRPPRNRGVN
ncbi:MAG: hypothetical protein FVQ80_11145 [Planctomycetes bacterium]|nr:hypothetical protein [Planctomycetota bacterium]